MKWAIYPCKYIRINPLDYISPDFAKSPRKAKRDENCFLTKDIIDLFFKEYPEYDPIGLAARISYWTALREGEVCGLTWDSVDLDKRVIYVENTICRNPYKNFGWEFTRPKTPASIAPVTFSSKLEHVLRHKKELQDIRRSENLYLKYHIEEGLVSLAGNEKETLPFVCTDTFGRFLKPSQVILECNKFSKKYATHLNFHMFRHTHATYLHEKGIDIKEIQHRLRHKNASTTINIYTHSTRALQAEA
ncbi:MAG: site-specific integrase, partial [Niameybacter sp.]